MFSIHGFKFFEKIFWDYKDITIISSEFKILIAPSGLNARVFYFSYTKIVLIKKIIFIDSFNLYHSLANKRLSKYKCLDLRSLVEKFIIKKRA